MSLTESQIKKLERLHNYSTKYELIAVADGVKALAGYCKKGKPSMLSMIRKNGEAWLAAGKSDKMSFVKVGAADHLLLGRCEIYFSGRTQREAITEGELPWFEDVF